MLRHLAIKVIKLVFGSYYQIRSSQLAKNALTVFCYHDVSSEPSEFSLDYDLNVYPDIFDYQIRFIKKHFNIISPDDLLNDEIPQNAALITFDDGFLGFFRNAVPILEKQQVPVLVFLNMAPILGKTFWAGLITYICKNRKDFGGYLRGKVNIKENWPLFLYCSEEIINSYLVHIGENFESEVSRYVGAFASEKDLESVKENKFIYFGNHLYNHHVPRLMTDKELIASFEDNVTQLEKYENYRNIFSFPFGQPASCFTPDQVRLLYDRCTKNMFSSSGRINYENGEVLDRVALSSKQNNVTDMWFEIFKHRSIARLDGMRRSLGL